MIRNTDILNYNTRIAVSYGAKYSPNLIAREQVMKNIKVAEVAIPALMIMLNLPERIWVRICYIKSKQTYGQYWAVSKLAEVDGRITPREFLETLCHELVHAEQYNTGKLTWEKHNNKFVDYWYNQPVNEEYRQRPWEKEAFERQVILANEILKQNPELNSIVF